MKQFDLGRRIRPMSTSSTEAQRWFDLGLNWCYGFNHEEGVRCFQRALEADPGCVMAHWGVAYGLGPFYNLAWWELGEQEAAAAISFGYAHIGQARALAAQGSAVENRLVEALASRFQQPHAVSSEEYDRWDDDYAAEMRRVHYDHPDDHDVMALFAEALITRTPRRLWDVKTGRPARNSDVVEATPCANGRSRKPTRPGGCSIRRSPTCSFTRWRCPTSLGAPWHPPTRSRRSGPTPVT
jgi:hypothetical protein